MAKLVIQDAYILVPIRKHLRNYLYFPSGPAGQSQGPTVRAKLRPVHLLKDRSFPLTSLRLQGLDEMTYLDAWLSWAESSQLCQHHTQQAKT